MPEGLAWAPPQPEGLVWFETDPATGAVKPDGLWQRYVRGELAPAEAAALRARVTDLYDRALWDENQRVFLLTEGLDVQLARSAPMAALEVHALVLHGARPSPAPPMEAASWPDQLWSTQSGGRIGTATEVARWEGQQKLRQVDDQAVVVDLAAVPSEAAPAPAPAGALSPLRDAARASAAAPVALDPAVIGALQAAGYIDGGSPAP